MGKRGRAPAPTALKLVNGTRACRVNTDEPQPGEDLPICPPEADQAVREVWDYTLSHLDQMRLVRAPDRDLLYAYCEAVMAHREASKILAHEGLVAYTPSGNMQRHPATGIQKEAAMTMRQLAQEFGLSPSARSGIRMAALEPAKEQGAGRLLTG